MAAVVRKGSCSTNVSECGAKKVNKNTDNFSHFSLPSALHLSISAYFLLIPSSLPASSWSVTLFFLFLQFMMPMNIDWATFCSTGFRDIVKRTASPVVTLEWQRTLDDQVGRGFYLAENNNNVLLNAQITQLDEVEAISPTIDAPKGRTLSQKTVDQVWREIQEAQIRKFSGPAAVFQEAVTVQVDRESRLGKNPSLGEMTLEDFLLMLGWYRWRQRQ